MNAYVSNEGLSLEPRRNETWELLGPATAIRVTTVSVSNLSPVQLDANGQLPRRRLVRVYNNGTDKIFVAFAEKDNSDLDFTTAEGLPILSDGVQTFLVSDKVEVWAIAKSAPQDVRFYEEAYG